MPELPEVETTLRGIQPHIESHKVSQVLVRQHNLRWPIPLNLHTILTGQRVSQLSRRGKYLLLHFQASTLLIHLGMSGSLRILQTPITPQKHDHLDIVFDNKIILRFTDPRRFGACLWTDNNVYDHILLKNLGPEPLDDEFNGAYLAKKAAKRKVAIKSLIMNNHIVVGVGNIYATEALFAAGIHPEKPAHAISEKQYAFLVKHIKRILSKAIKAGGTTLKDFLHSDGKPGYFRIHLLAYGRSGLPCLQCKTPLEQIQLGQRTSVFCKVCQPT